MGFREAPIKTVCEDALKYPDGQEIRLGDIVRLNGGAEGVVVFSIDTDEYSCDFPKADWEYLAHGVMIDFPSYGLIHFDKDEPDLALIRRAR